MARHGWGWVAAPSFGSDSVPRLEAGSVGAGSDHDQDHGKILHPWMAKHSHCGGGAVGLHCQLSTACLYH